MENKELTYAIEAILFIAGDGVETEKFAEIFELPKEEMEAILNEFADQYNYEGHGMRILKYGTSYQMATRSEYIDFVRRFAGSKRPNNLSNAALEVLSIIAYNQPVTRATIDKIRGVDSFGPLDKLLEREIVEEKGRLDAPGRPILYGTTPEFLKIFGLQGMEDLPDLNSIQLSMDDINSGEDQPLS